MCDVKGRCETIYGNYYIFLLTYGFMRKASQKLTPHRSAEEKEHLKRFPGISYYSFSHMHFSDIASDTTYFSTTKRIPILVL